MKELRLEHSRPNIHTVIREGQKWQRNPSKDRVTSDNIHTVKEIKEEGGILMENDEDGSVVELFEAEEILNTENWTYWGEA